ncbi:ABC transporter permease (plasmid) [Mesorhizobium atlanticum]
MKTDVSNAGVAIVDADHSILSASIKDALQPPYFRAPREIDRSELDELPGQGNITPLSSKFRRASKPIYWRTAALAIQINVDATAVAQAAVGTAYIQQIISRETASFLHAHGANQAVPIEPVIRALFNQNLEAIRFSASMGIINNVTILAVILAGAAVMRERERGTIEHLLVMPVLPNRNSCGKDLGQWIDRHLVAAGLSLHLVVQFALQVPIVGSVEILPCRGRRLSVRRYVARYLAGHHRQLDAAIRAVGDPGLHRDVLAVRLVHALREHAGVAARHHVRVTVDAFCQIRAIRSSIEAPELTSSGRISRQWQRSVPRLSLLPCHASGRCSHGRRNQDQRYCLRDSYGGLGAWLR